MKNDSDPVKRHSARHAVPRVEHYIHLIYFALVALHGPYHYAAAVCFVIGIAALIVAKEG